jgi:hydrogenase maturation factor
MSAVHRIPTGKLPHDILKRVVFERLGVYNERILQGPHVGEDAAVIDMGDRVIVVATDPITGAIGNVGWLAVHVNANDVASTGARPLWFLCVTLLPEGADEALLEDIMKQMHTACKEIGIALVGGHTETTPGLDRPILIGFMIGESSKEDYITTGGAQPGDSIILTKTAGIEGTAVLAEDLAKVLERKIDGSVLYAAKQMVKRISVVSEAMRAVELGGVHSLHDPTEGGLLNGIWEMAEAAGVGVEIVESNIKIAPETKAVCEALNVNPLKVMGSGALLIVIEREKEDKLLSSLSEIDVEASVIGVIKYPEEGRILVRPDGSREEIEAVDQDEVYRILEEYRFTEL